MLFFQNEFLLHIVRVAGETPARCAPRGLGDEEESPHLRVMHMMLLTQRNFYFCFFGNDLFKTIPLLLKMLLPNKPCILITKITFIAVCTSMALLCLLWESPSPEQIQTWKCSKHPAAISTSANGFSLLEYPSWVTCAWTICFLR